MIAHKIVSKAEGRVRSLAEVLPSERAIQLAGGRDPRLVQVVLDETREIVRASPGVIVCETHHGFVCANAGVDQSNVPGDDTVLMLPLDPDASARAIRARTPRADRGRARDRDHRLLRARVAHRSERRRDRPCGCGGAR